MRFYFLGNAKGGLGFVDAGEHELAVRVPRGFLPTNLRSDGATNDVMLASLRIDGDEQLAVERLAEHPLPLAIFRWSTLPMQLDLVRARELVQVKLLVPRATGLVLSIGDERF